MRDGLQGRSYLEELDCSVTVLLVKAGGLREFSVVDGFVANGLVEAEKQEGSGMTTGILEARSTGARIQPMASYKVFPEILILS